MSSPKRFFPFNAEQTVNILSEFGPLVTMFIVNAAYGINAGTKALIATTVIAIGAMFYMFHRPPFFPLIASTVTVVFGALTLYTDNPMWVQIKVTIFNLMFAGVLLGGLRADRGVCAGVSATSVSALVAVLCAGQLAMLALSARPANPMELLQLISTSTGVICAVALFAGYLIGLYLLRRNFFEYVFEKTFHYTREGWDRFTFSFAWFFVVTALANEFVRLSFKDTYTYDLFGIEMSGINIWILFKIALVMPASGLYAWFLTRLMHKYRLPEPVHPAPATHKGLAPAVAVAEVGGDTRATDASGKHRH
jgi:intracellular septation protein A